MGELFRLAIGATPEGAGRAFLPALRDALLAPCFRNDPTYVGEKLQQIIDAKSSIQSCLTSSIAFYGQLLAWVAGLVAFVFIVKAGYSMMTAFGDEAKYTQGKKTLLYAMIGLAMSISAGFLIAFFVRLLGYQGTAPFI